MRRTLLLSFAIIGVALTLSAPQVGARRGEGVGAPQKVSDHVTYVSGTERGELINKVLSRREFDRSGTVLAERFVAWLARTLSGMFGDSDFSFSAVRSISQGLAVAVIIAFLVLLALIVARLGFGRWATGCAAVDGDTGGGPGSSGLAIEEASRAAGAGDFRSAVRLVYMGVLLRLDEQDLIRFDGTSTNWEYLARLKKTSPVYELLRPVTVLFDVKWYGQEPAVRSDYERVLEVYRAVESQEVAS
jgi:hypothetical protein